VGSAVTQGEHHVAVMAERAAANQVAPPPFVRGKWRGWLPLLVLPPGVVLLFPPHGPRWALMWVLAGSVFAGCKWLTWRQAHVAGVRGWRHAAYLTAWPGLDASAFLTRRSDLRPSGREWIAAALKTALGGTLIYLGSSWAFGDRPYLAGWMGMAGIVLSLHFGLFHLMSCAWRQMGVDARPLMDSPLRSMSVSEFWSRRWNTAFRDLTHRFLFRPLTPYLGVRGAIIGGFVFSGLVHDLVISLPAGGGYGGPTLFFALQALAVLFERSEFGAGLGLGRGLPGRISTAMVVVLPLGFLFHAPFVERVVVPFLRAL